MSGSNKVEKPGKMYVVTRKTSQGSVGTSTGGKVCIIINLSKCSIISNFCFYL